VLTELWRSWQLPHKLNGGGRGGLYWPGPPQLPVHKLGGWGGREVLIELLRSWQLPQKLNGLDT
jgi:hypothetical protein